MVSDQNRLETMNDKVEFNFRVWVHPEDGDQADIEVWYQGFEPTNIREVSVADWARESLGYEDFYRLFDLDRTKHWQVVGKATLRSHNDYYGGYDEDLDIIEFEKAEVPEKWFSDSNTLSLDETEIHDNK